MPTENRGFPRELGSLQRRMSWQGTGPFSKEQGKCNQQGAVTAGSMMDCSLITFGDFFSTDLEQ